MTRQTDIEADLALELSGSGITLPTFRRGVNAFVGLLEVLTGSVCVAVPSVEWQIQVRDGGNLIGASAAKNSAESKVRSVLELAGGCFGPSGTGSTGVVTFPEGAKKHVRELAKLSIETGTRVGFWVGQERHEVEPRLAKSMRSAPARATTLPGTVEGHVSALHDRDSIYFELREYFGKRSIKCVVKDDLIETCKDLWRKRVTVHGIVQYDRDGLPSKVDVRDIVPFPPDTELPSYLDVRGILKKYK